jgi:hypothetical protein
MATVRFRRWVLEVDPERTREAHSKVRRGRAEECGCEPCRNYIAARGHLFAGESLALLHDMGIDPAREVEAYHNARLASGLHSYGGWFHAIGKIVSGGECWREVAPDMRVPELESLSTHLAVGFQSQCALVRESFRGLQLFQVEFQAELPWLISAPEPQ